MEAELEAFVAGPDGAATGLPRSKLVVVDLGSMAEVGMQRCDWVTLATRLCGAIRKAGLRALVLHFPPDITSTLITSRVGFPSADVSSSPSGSGVKADKDEEWVRVEATPIVPHSWLFPQALVVVHHGGLGTTTACIR